MDGRPPIQTELRRSRGRYHGFVSSLEKIPSHFRPSDLHIIQRLTLRVEEIMVRILECADSGILLVIPDDSHVWRNEIEARKLRSGAQRVLKRALDAAAKAAPLRSERLAAS